MRMWVQSLALLSGLRIQHRHELQCRSQSRLESQHSWGCGIGQQLQLQPLAWELPYATCVALKRQKKKKKKKVVKMGSFLVTQQVEDLALSLLWVWLLLWHRFNPWTRNFQMPQVRPTKMVKMANFILCTYFYCFFFRATPKAYGSSQARGRTGAGAAGLHHNDSNVRSKPSL